MFRNLEDFERIDSDFNEEGYISDRHDGMYSIYIKVEQKYVDQEYVIHFNSRTVTLTLLQVERQELIVQQTIKLDELRSMSWIALWNLKFCEIVYHDGFRSGCFSFFFMLYTEKIRDGHYSVWEVVRKEEEKKKMVSLSMKKAYNLCADYEEIEATNAFLYNLLYINRSTVIGILKPIDNNKCSLVSLKEGICNEQLFMWRRFVNPIYIEHFFVIKISEDIIWWVNRYHWILYSIRIKRPIKIANFNKACTFYFTVNQTLIAAYKECDREISVYTIRNNSFRRIKTISLSKILTNLKGGPSIKRIFDVCHGRKQLFQVKDNYTYPSLKFVIVDMISGKSTAYVFRILNHIVNNYSTVSLQEDGDIILLNYLQARGSTCYNLQLLRSKIF